MAVTAVTGAIGAGKSTLSKILASLMKCRLINADALAAELWARNDVKASAVSRWGGGILDADGKIIKSEIARHIFSDITENRFINSLLHPLVMNQIHQSVNALNDSNLVIEIPLLPETGRPDWINKVIFVGASFGLRAERCRVSRGWSSDELRRREKFLLPEEQRLSICDFIIHNDGSLSDLEGQAVKFLQENFYDEQH